MFWGTFARQGKTRIRKKNAYCTDPDSPGLGTEDIYNGLIRTRTVHVLDTDVRDQTQTEKKYSREMSEAAR